MCEQCKEKDEFDKNFERAVKQEADPDCKICNGTGFIESGWGRGFVCGCVTNFDDN